MVGFAEHKQALDDLGASVVAASVDPIDKAREVADGLNFPIGYGVQREISDLLGAWWDERRQFIQPSEFILGPKNKVASSSYSAGPLGRLQAEDVVSILKFIESRSSS